MHFAGHLLRYHLSHVRHFLIEHIRVPAEESAAVELRKKRREPQTGR